MDELRHLHLGAPAPARSVLAGLQAAYEEVAARNRGSLPADEADSGIDLTGSDVSTEA
jgi:hypothetical protein